MAWLSCEEVNHGSSLGASGEPSGAEGWGASRKITIKR
jgi:hypothetical protein